MYCQQCGKALSENDLDRETFIANCQNCYSMSDFSRIPAITGKNIPKRKNVPLPAGLKVEKTDRNLIIKSSWFGGFSSIFFTCFCSHMGYRLDCRSFRFKRYSINLTCNNASWHCRCNNNLYSHYNAFKSDCF